MKKEGPGFRDWGESRGPYCDSTGGVPPTLPGRGMAGTLGERDYMDPGFAEFVPAKFMQCKKFSGRARTRPRSDAVLAAEFVHAARGVDNFLLAGVEGMAC